VPFVLVIMCSASHPKWEKHKHGEDRPLLPFDYFDALHSGLR
jgi:hypothetical protein